MENPLPIHCDTVRPQHRNQAFDLLFFLGVQQATRKGIVVLGHEGKAGKVHTPVLGGFLDPGE
jgi:hypothetical protein